MRAISPLPGNIFALCMLFEIVMARSSPHVSISRRNQAIRNAWRGNLAVKDRFSRRDARNHAWRMILAMGIAPPLRSALGMCRHGPSRAPGETLVSTERIPGQAHFWIACWAVWVSGCCGIVQAAFSKLRLQIGGGEFPPASCCRRNGGTSRVMSGAVLGVLMAPLLFCECFRIYSRFDR